MKISIPGMDSFFQLKLIKISRWVNIRSDAKLSRNSKTAWVERKSRSDDVWGVGWLNRWWINHIIAWCAIHWCENIHSTGNIVSDLWPSFCSHGTWFYCSFSFGSSARSLSPLISYNSVPGTRKGFACHYAAVRSARAREGNAPVLWRYNRYQMRVHFHTEITTLRIYIAMHGRTITYISSSVYVQRYLHS